MGKKKGQGHGQANPDEKQKQALPPQPSTSQQGPSQQGQATEQKSQRPKRQSQGPKQQPQSSKQQLQGSETQHLATTSQQQGFTSQAWKPVEVPWQQGQAPEEKSQRTKRQSQGSKQQPQGSKQQQGPETQHLAATSQQQGFTSQAWRPQEVPWQHGQPITQEGQTTQKVQVAKQQGPRPKHQPQQPSQQQVPPSSVQDITEKLVLTDLSESSTVVSSDRSSSSTTRSTVIPSTALIPVAPNKGRGTNGRKITVDVNFLPLFIDKLLPTVYQYDVTIEPNLPKRLLPEIFEEYRKKNFKGVRVAFDGQKIAVSPKILQINENTQKQTKVTDENGRERVYMVTIKEARDNKIDFGSLKNYINMRQYDAPLRAIQMLEIVLKSPFLDKMGVQSGRSFYMLPRTRHDLGDNYELWTGLYQSTVLGSQPYLNVDIAHKAFPSTEKIIDILQNMRIDPRNDLDRLAQTDLLSHLKGLMINYAMPGQEASRRTYKFLGFERNAGTFKFRNDQDNKECTIAEYFKSRGVRLTYPHLPTIKLGNTIKNITVPMECCSVAGFQAVKKKCTEQQTRNMIRVAATSTDERKRKIMDMLKQIAHNQSQTLSEFGIKVGEQFSNVPARILDAPTLEYKNKQIKPSNGQWRIDNLQFLKAKPLTRYAVLLVDRRTRDDKVREFCSMINRIGGTLDMKIDSKYEIYSLDPFSRDFVRDMAAQMSKMINQNIELIFCVIPDGGDTYAKVKQCAELRCGILTQCVKGSTLFKKATDQSTISNILLKVNAKLNGTNHKFAPSSRLPLMCKPFMLVGADVTHPSPGQDNIPSVVGVVSSHDVYGFQYNKCWRLQDPKQEMISDFDEIIKEHLGYFENTTKRLPDAILYFRDGVSEGQFQQVLTIELNAMYRGCAQYRPDYKPKITFIVVQKRHHTRFFPPPNSGLGKDDKRNNNVPPGTIVDTQITHPNETQFYLVSHQSIQGVARPTKYCLLRDDSNFSIDDLQSLTYNLCHFFARCTRSVSYPAPTYYAHLAASRGRVYIEGANINMGDLDREFSNRTVKEVISKGHPMYFV